MWTAEGELADFGVHMHYPSVLVKFKLIQQASGRGLDAAFLTHSQAVSMLCDHGLAR